MTTTTQAMTADDLLHMQGTGVRCELIKGELVEMAPAGSEHGSVAMRLGWRLAQHVETHGLGEAYAAETGFRLASNPDTVRAPDAAFVRSERLKEVGSVQGYWPGAPDLAIEVVSPADSYGQVEAKVVDWLRAGTRMVLIVNPREQTVTVHRSFSDIAILTEGDVLEGGDVVPGWACPVADIFA